MANNPLYPGYYPGKKDEESINPLYPGYYTGQPLQKRPQSKEYLQPVEFNFDAISEQIDEVADSVARPFLAPKWVVDRVIDDWKGNLKVSVKSGGSLDPTSLDDFSTQDYPGAVTTLSLNPKDWGISAKGLDTEQTKKQISKTLSSWFKESTGIDSKNLLKSDFSDIQNWQTSKLWGSALGYGEPTTTTQQHIKGGEAIAGRTTAFFPDVRDEPQPLKISHVQAKSRKREGGRTIVTNYDDLYAKTANDALEFVKSRDNPGKRDSKHSGFVTSALSAANIEILDKYQRHPNGNAAMSPHIGAVKFFDTRVKTLEDIGKFQSKTVDNIGKAISHGTGVPTGTNRFDHSKSMINDLQNGLNARLASARQMERQGQISQQSLDRFSKHISGYQSHLESLKNTLDKAKDGNISSVQAIKILEGTTPGNNFTSRSTFKDSLNGGLVRDLENSLITDSQDEIGSLLKDPNLGALDVDIRAKNLGPLMYRLRQDRIRFATKEVLDTFDKGGIGQVAETYAWKLIKNKMPKRLEEFSSGQWIENRLLKTNYFGLKIDEKKGNIPKETSLRRYARFERKYGYKVDLKLDSSLANSLGMAGTKKLRLKGGDHFKILANTGISDIANSDPAFMRTLLSISGNTTPSNAIKGRLSQQLFGVNWANLSDERRKEIEGLLEKLKRHNEWVNENFPNLNPDQKLAFLKGLLRKNKELNDGYKLDRKFVGRLDKINNKMNTILKKFESSFVGKTIQKISNWQQIVAEKAVAAISKLLSEALGIAAGATGFLATIMPAIQAIAEKVIKKGIEYAVASIKGLIKLDFKDFDKLLQKDIKHITEAVVVIFTIIVVVVFLPITALFGTVATTTSPVDSTYAASDFGEQASLHTFYLGTCTLTPEVLAGAPSWYYSQCNSTWSSIQIDSSRYSVGNAGCTLTTISMVYNYFGYSCVTPEVVVNTGHFGTDGNINSRDTSAWDTWINESSPECIPEEGSGIKTEYFGGGMKVSAIEPTLVNWFNQHPDGVISFGMFSPGGSQHWVILKWDSGKIIIVDPYPTTGSPAVSDFPGIYGNWTVTTSQPSGYYR